MTTKHECSGRIFRKNSKKRNILIKPRNKKQPLSREAIAKLIDLLEPKRSKELKYS